MNNLLAVLDFVSALYLIVIVVVANQSTKEALEKTKFFGFCIFACTLGCFVEAFCILKDGTASMNSLLVIAHYLSIVLVDVIVFFYAMFLHTFFYEKGRIHRRITGILAILAVISFALNTVMFAIGHMFTINNGIFVPGSYFPYRQFLPMIIFIGIYVLYMFNRKALGFDNIWLTLLFFVIPSGELAILYAFSLPMEKCTFTLTAISLFVVHMVVQTKIITEIDVNARVLGRLSYYDTLTGLKNRRGYDDIIASLTSEDKVSVVFCDANGLKFVNDNQGHLSGDKYIKKIAEIISAAFPEGDVCRISGDEFVCIIKNIEDKVFAERIEDFKAVLASEGRIAAFGYETGKGCNFQDLIKSAEKKMYSDKQLYYIETGRDRRHY